MHPTFDQFKAGSIINTTSIITKRPLTVQVKRDQFSGRMFVHHFLNKFEQGKSFINDESELMNIYNIAVL